MTNLDDHHCRGFEDSDARKKQKPASAHNGASENQPVTTGKNGGEDKSQGKPTQAELLIALARDNVELLFHDQDRAYADMRVDEHRETWPVKSKRFRQWLKRLYYAKHNKVPNAEAVQEALDHAVDNAMLHDEG